jgi:hypothetical protein
MLSGDMLHADYAAHFAMAFLFSDQRGLDPSLVQNKGSVIPYSRNLSISAARQNGATHVLFIDTDQTFPHDTAVRLLDRLQKDRSALVVAGSLRKRVPPHTLCHVEMDGSPGHLEPDETGVREVSKIGTGCMLIDMHVFLDMKRPYFYFSSDDGRDAPLGEDYNFCNDVRKNGGKILLDCDLSHQLGHIGQHTIFTTVRETGIAAIGGKE